jgi:hypothetical protein
MNLFTKALVTTVVVSCHLSPAKASMIDEISIDSVDTIYGGSIDNGGTGALTISQDRIVLLMEMADNSQDAIIGVDFELVTFLQTDKSIAGEAIADFFAGTITVTKATEVLLTADIGIFNIEESLYASVYQLAGSGDFTVTGGTLASQFGPKGVLFDITWELPSNIDNFQDGFTAESDVTLTPEPATMILLGSGALLAVNRRLRNKSNC